MPQARIDLTRRRLCAGALIACADALCLGAFSRARAQAPALPPAQAPAPAVNADHGRVIPPVPIPGVTVRCADGRMASLAALLQGHVTAVHLMFTGCLSVCPIQGAIFQRVQSLLPEQGPQAIQLLSLSIDPLGDTPAAMRNWLQRFGAHAGWIAAAPEVADLDRLLELFGQGRDAVESHATQVSIINRRGELIWRTQQLPSADSIADLLQKV